ncbi:MAG: glycosyl transferase family 2 [Bacteroidetes bacterium MedPE-SWsnd-G1]|nr:MAG: glycosyl transferase family 2 [Bacteroidetes bacterium MedPE-SWsnd-G1]
MIFKFLTYIRPVWYFNKARMDDSTVFPNPNDIPKEVWEQIEVDEGYISEMAIERDLAWQAHQKGYIGKSNTLKFSDRVPLIDEYRFVRKYHKKHWATYCLLMRLLSFCNPIKELSAWNKTRSIKQKAIFKKQLLVDWNSYSSSLVQKCPKITIIIPTLNRYNYLKDVLLDLEKQDYSNFDVIIMDQSEPFNKSFYNQFQLDIHVEYQKEKALWLARNMAIKKSDAMYYLLFDDDSRVNPDWISNHLKGLDYFNAAISSGQSISKKDQKLPENYSYFRIADLLDTGNVLIKREVFESIGLFDRQFEKQRMGDGEFGMRAYLNGFLNISNPYATRLHLKVKSGGLRQMGSWDAFRPKNIFAPKPIPSVLYLYRKYFGNNLAKWALIKSIPPSIIPYKFKKNKPLLVLGVLISILLFPLVLIQIVNSWRQASIKLEHGPEIEKYG